MKLTRNNLRGLIKEELTHVLSEQIQPFDFTVEYDTYQNQYDQTDWYFKWIEGGEELEIKILYTGRPSTDDIAWRLMDDSGLTDRMHATGIAEGSPEEMAAHAEVVRQIDSQPLWKVDVPEATKMMYDYPGY
jgi:hypothetical protein